MSKERIAELEKGYAAQIAAFGHAVEIHNAGRGQWRVLLHIENQSFWIGEVQDDEADAQWHRIMLCVALARLRPA